MSRRDDITGRKAMNGYRSSKANNKTKHRFHLNLQNGASIFQKKTDGYFKSVCKDLRTINKKVLRLY